MCVVMNNSIDLLAERWPFCNCRAAASPSPLALAPIRKPGRQVWIGEPLYGGLFVIGMLLTHVALGLAASLGGSWVQQLLGRAWGLVLGPLLIILGLIWPGWLHLPLPAWRLRAKPVTGAWGAFMLGVPFSVAICPFCTPALLVLLGVAASIGSPGFGTALLLAFALGRAVPILLGAVAIGWLENLSGLHKFHSVCETSGGILLILSGLYMLNAYFYLIPALAA